MRKIIAALCLAVLCAGLAQAQKLNSLTASSLLSTKKVPVVIAAGNTFQTVLPAVTINPSSGTEARNSLTIQNNNAVDNCWIVIGGTLGAATTGTAILLLAGGSYTRYYPYIPSDAIHATCGSTSDTLYVDFQ